MQGILNKYWYLILLIGLIVMWALWPKSEPVNVNDLINQNLQNKIEQLKSDRHKKCKQALYELAVAKADTLVRQQAAGLIKPQQLQVNKPQKPNAPDIKQQKDSVDLKPLWD